MRYKKTILSAGLATLALIGSAASAFAATAYATTNVNVRSGPSTAYSVVDTLLTGDRVEIDRCRGNWCLVYSRAAEGWVSASYLDNDSRVTVRRVDPSVDVDIHVGNPRPVYRPWHRPYRHSHRGWHDDYWDRPYYGGGTGFSFSFGL